MAFPAGQAALFCVSPRPRVTDTNLQIKLASRPTRQVTAENFVTELHPIPRPRDGEVLLRTRYLSLDPAMRGWLRDVRSYMPPVAIGEVMRALGIGEVIESRDPGFAPGELCEGLLGWQHFATLPGGGLRKIDERLAPAPSHLGVLGVTGMTAYFGLLEVGALGDGETVLVSAAAGATGSVAGQLARIKGCRTVGVAGGADKCAFVVGELGFDDCIDYKAEADLDAAIVRTCPGGVDVYFDNVGGAVLNAALRRLRRGARVVLSGAISQYNEEKLLPGPSNYLSLQVRRARMEGFVVFDYQDRYDEAARVMAAWMREGKLKGHEQFVDGLEHAVEALQLLFSGGNTGKLILRI
jgi:NADPH-dependent curcumin reductase CurA